MGRDGEMDWLMQDLSEELKAWGHPGCEAGHIVIKTDGEPSITAIRDALAKFHGGRVVAELPPRGESQSNGAVEEAGKTAREYMRVLKEQLEDKAQMTIAGADVIAAWLVRWGAMLCSRYAVGRDGLTPYERRRGRRCVIPVVPFGEKVWYKEIRQTKERANKLESEWREGVWLGHARNSNEHLIGTRVGAVKAYAIKRQPEGQRWSAAIISELQGTPQQPDPSKPGIAIPVRIQFDSVEAAPLPPPAEASRRQIRRMRINETILKKYGFTSNCEGCRFRRAGLGETRGHSEECRTRIEAAMAEDELGKQILEEQRQRISRRRAEQAEEAEVAPAQDPAPTPGEPRADLEMTQSAAAAGCSNSGACSSSPSKDDTAQDANMTVRSEPASQSGELPNLARDDRGSDIEVHDGGPRGGDCTHASPGGRRRSRSRSPKRGLEEFEIGTPLREDTCIGGGEIVVDAREDPGIKREAPADESEPKRLKPET